MIKKLLLLSAMASAFAPVKSKSWRHKDLKACLHCEKPHKHNNAFCSAKCCKAHKGKANEE